MHMHLAFSPRCTIDLASLLRSRYAWFRRESVIFAQLQGIKKFTFWHPASLPKMCLYPYGE